VNVNITEKRIHGAGVFSCATALGSNSELTIDIKQNALPNYLGEILLPEFCYDLVES
jgi:hypothetical protein